MIGALTSALKLVFVRPVSRVESACLDGFRALSFAWIFQVHLVATLFLQAPTAHLERYMRERPLYVEFVMRGHVAVDVFNVLAAYLATKSLLTAYNAQGRVPVLGWVRRRLLRIVPSYYVFLALCVTIHVLAEPLPNFHNAWRNFAFVNNFLAMPDHFMNHTWTQALEVQFAVLLPPLIFVVLKAAGTVRDHQRRIFRPFSHGPFYRTMAALLALGVAVRLAAILFVAWYTEEGLRIPAQVHDVHWLDNRMPPAISNFYQFIYLPLWGRLSSFFCGVVIGYVRHFSSIAEIEASSVAHSAKEEVDVGSLDEDESGAGGSGLLDLSALSGQDLREDSMISNHKVEGNYAYLLCSNSRVLACLAIMLASILPRLTSDTADAYYPVPAAVVFLALHRVLFGVPFCIIVYWCLEESALEAQKARYGDGTHLNKFRSGGLLIRTINGFFSLSVWYPLSVLSYVGYLLHVLVIGGVQVGMAQDDVPLTNARVWWAAALSFGVTLVVSFVFFALVECPIQAWRRNRERLVVSAVQQQQQLQQQQQRIKKE